LTNTRADIIVTGKRRHLFLSQERLMYGISRVLLFTRKVDGSESIARLEATAAALCEVSCAAEVHPVTMGVVGLLVDDPSPESEGRLLADGWAYEGPV
jgi:hypothetical protein